MKKSNLAKLISNGDFEKARVIKHEMDKGEFANEIMVIAFEDKDISVYTFIYYLLSSEEDSRLHRIASNLMCHVFKDYKGAYKSGLFHTRRAIELSPNYLVYREMLLFFGSIPNKLISNQELKEVCEFILSKDPNNEAVKAFQSLKIIKCRSLS
ncbi:cupin domain-containing protein [Bacillus sp. Cs-700]|uniref:cupin domain-containing protein n=1 Tax=Bacillus sp. Cs-700 TaxID=2589818 RepID=UPI00140E4A58|nr:cupin domain-containing protein [Bacillus sp. Cs-700]